EQAMVTPTPSDNAIPSQTPEVLATATPLTPSLVFSSYGTTLQKQEDGSTLYIDQIAGYQFQESPEWTVVRPNEQEYFELMELTIASDPTVQKSLNNVNNSDPNSIRLYGFDFRDGHIREDFIINFDVTLNKDLVGSYDDVFNQIK